MIDTLSKDRKIKVLNTQLEDAQVERKLITDKIDTLSKSKYEIGDKIKSIEKQILKVKLNDTIQVSEHAILRYVERVMKIDINEIASKIVTDDVKELAYAFGNGTYPTSYNYSVVVKNGMVTTVLI